MGIGARCNLATCRRQRPFIVREAQGRSQGKALCVRFNRVGASHAGFGRAAGKLFGRSGCDVTSGNETGGNRAAAGALFRAMGRVARPDGRHGYRFENAQTSTRLNCLCCVSSSPNSCALACNLATSGSRQCERTIHSDSSACSSPRPFDSTCQVIARRPLSSVETAPLQSNW